MTSVDLGRVRRLVEDVHDLSVPERARFLDEACRGEGVLRAEVEALLAAAEEEPGFLASPVADPDAMRLPAAPAPGDVLGGCRLVRAIAQGGMGTVWEAEQEEPRRRVALKTLRADGFTPELLRRFRREAQILARLHHPGIAPIFAAGLHRSTPGLPGVPWYAMEYVEGARTLIDFARECELDLARRLALFLEVCAAVQHGHERGVVHRDLKPANVLVDRSGRVRVIDFGVAHVTAAAEAESAATEPGRLIGTLQYMSPEQLAGRAADVDARSDVYALGILLHELCTGEPPHRIGHLSFPEAVRALSEERRPRPRRVAPDLPLDLEAILLTALEPRRERRYPSVAALAEDVGLFLSGRPVGARAPSAVRQLRELARRHRVLSVSLAVGAVALLAGTLVSLLFALRATHAEREALGQRDLARFREYSADVAAAYGALLGLDSGGARRRLESSPQELRGFEWWTLRRRLDRSLWTTTTEGDAAYGLAWHPDGTRFFLLTSDGGVETRSARDGALLARLEGTNVVSTALALSPDGARLAVGRRDGSALLLSTATLAVERTWSADASSTNAVAFAPDGELLATGGPGGVRLWGVADGALRRELHALFGISSLAFAPDGKRLALGTSVSHAVEVLDLATGEPDLVLAEHGGYVSGVAFSPDGALLASSCHDGLVRLFDARTGELRRELRGHSGIVWGLAFDPRGELLATVGWDGTLREWDVASGEPLRAATGHEDDVLTEGFSPDGAHLLSSDADGRVKLWDRELGGPDALPVVGRWAWRLAFAPDGRLLCIHSGTAQVLDVPSGSVVTSFPDEREVYCGGYGPQGALALGDAGGRILVVHPDGTRVHTAEGTLARGAGELAWSDDGALLAGRAVAGGLVALDAGSPALPVLARGPSAAGPIAFRPGSHALAACRADGRVFLWSVADGGILELGSCGSPVRSLLWIEGGARLALGLADGRIVLRDPRGRAAPTELAGHSGEVLDLALAPDGSRLASASADRSVRLWDLAAAREVASFTEHKHTVHAVAFSRDGAWLASGSSDGTLRWWHAGTPAERRALELFDRLGAARDVRAALAGEASLTADEREAALAVAAELPDDPPELARRAWHAARRPGAARPVLEEAREQARRALADVPSLALARLSLAAVELRLGGPERCLALLSPPLAGTTAEVQRGHALRALADAARGREGEARAELGALSADAPLDTATHRLVAEARAALP